MSECPFCAYFLFSSSLGLIKLLVADCERPFRTILLFWVCILLAAKFNLGELYERVGFAKEYISRGKFAELDADQRPFKYVAVSL
jgi:hypothetical protein